MMERKVKDSKKCPTCGKTDEVVRIMYGLPTAEGWEEAKAGKYHLGGCCVSDDSPKWYCKRCDKEFGRLYQENINMPM